MSNVVFYTGTKEQYEAIPSHDSNALYWLSDVQEIRKGDGLYAKGTEATEFDAGLMSATDKAKVSKLRVGHTIPSRISEYLYEISYEDYDYSDGYQYMEQFDAAPMCSVLRKDNLVGRNLDWYYNEHPNFVIRTTASCGRHATLGASAGIGDLVVEVVKSGTEEEEYKVLPFFVSDAINDCGVFVNINVVAPGDRGHTIGTGGGQQRICQFMIPRYVADYADSAKDAISLLRNMDVYAPSNRINEEAHFMICDKNDTYIVEFVDNEMVVYSNTDSSCLPLPTGENIMTNFYINGWNGELKTVYAGYDAEEVMATGLNDHAMGIERYQILREQYENLDSWSGMAAAMQSVRYLLSYDMSIDPIWRSEFTGEYEDAQIGNLTIYSDASDFDEVLRRAAENYRRFQRDGSLWITTHTAIYDLETRRLSLFIEEDYGRKYEFQLVMPGVIPGAEWAEF